MHPSQIRDECFVASLGLIENPYFIDETDEGAPQDIAGTVTIAADTFYTELLARMGVLKGDALYGPAALPRFVALALRAWSHKMTKPIAGHAPDFVQMATHTLDVAQQTLNNMGDETV